MRKSQFTQFNFTDQLNSMCSNTRICNAPLSHKIAIQGRGCTSLVHTQPSTSHQLLCVCTAFLQCLLFIIVAHLCNNSGLPVRPDTHTAVTILTLNGSLIIIIIITKILFVLKVQQRNKVHININIGSNN